MNYTINIAGSGTADEIVKALDDVQEYINNKVERGEEGELDSFRMDFPKGAPVDQQTFSVLIKLKF